MSEQFFELLPFKLEKGQIKINVDLFTNHQMISLTYRISHIELINTSHQPVSEIRKLKLWEKTCFEFFIKNEQGEYYEFNFAPNHDWNCFYFPSKGSPLVEHPIKERIMIKWNDEKDFATLSVSINTQNFHHNFMKGTLTAGISSVIEDLQGQLSYWALVHCDSRPNFHHFDSFIAEIKL